MCAASSPARSPRRWAMRPPRRSPSRSISRPCRTARMRASRMPAARLPGPDQALAHGDLLRVGTLQFRVRRAPGHSPGSVVFEGQGVAFAGDVLFQGSVGRTDLPGGDFETLIRSIERELLTLPDSTIVYSGHGPETTVGRERRANPFLTDAYRLG